MNRVRAIARPDLRITLVEPLLRRTIFLSEFIEAAGFAAVAIVGTAMAQGTPPNPNVANPAVGAGQQSSQQTPMGTTGTQGGSAATGASTMGATGTTAGSTTGSSAPSSSSTMGASSDTGSAGSTRAMRADRN